MKPHPSAPPAARPRPRAPPPLFSLPRANLPQNTNKGGRHHAPPVHAISADGHLEVPPERWTHRVPARYRDRAPHTIHLPDGGDALMIEGQPLLEANFLDLRAGHASGTWQPFGIKVDNAAGTGSPEQRVREQDQDGLDAEILFAAMVAGPVFWRNIAHDVVYKAVVRGYNDWLAEEYCSVAPDRLVGMGVMPITNVDDAIAELQHCKKLGLKGVLLGGLPNGKGYPTGGRPVLAAALDLDMPVTAHVQFTAPGRGPRSRPSNTRRRTGHHGPVAPALPGMADHFGLPPAVVRPNSSWPACSSASQSCKSCSPRPVSAGCRSGSSTWTLYNATWGGHRGIPGLQAAETSARRLRPPEHPLHRPV